MSIQRLDNVSVVVENLEAAKTFFVELGLEVVGETRVEGDWVDRVVGLEGVRVDIVMVETPDGHGRLELTKFLTPDVEGPVRPAPANTLGIRRIAFQVDDLDATVAGLEERGTELLGEIVNYKDVYRLCYVRGPEGILLMLAEKLG